MSFLVNQYFHSTHNPSYEGRLKVKHILRYLRGTILDGLKLYKKPNLSLYLYLKFFFII